MPRTSAPLAIAAALLAPGAAGAQGYAHAPFQERPVEVAQAAALERIEVAARALAAAQPAGEEEEDGEEGGPLHDLALFEASLAAASPELATSLGAAVEAMSQAAERGEDASGPAGEVLGLVEEARAALPATGLDDPGFRAALMALLLLDEGGVAEGYEEASGGEDGAYALGWFALARVKALWAGLAAEATPEQAAEVAATLAILDGLFPSPEVPDALSRDPEQAEAPAQALVGLLEGVTDAELYPGRDLARAAGLVHRVAEGGCASLEAGDAGVGAEALAIAAAYHAGTVRDTLGVLAPEAGAAVEAGFDALDPERPDEATAACGALLAALADGQAALAP